MINSIKQMSNKQPLTGATEIPEVQSIIRSRLDEVSSLMREASRESHFPPRPRPDVQRPPPGFGEPEKSALRRLN